MVKIKKTQGKKWGFKMKFLISQSFQTKSIQSVLVTL